MICTRGDIYMAKLSPVAETVGSEQGGTRPVIILQNNTGNKYSPTVIVAVITSRMNKAKLPTHVEISESFLPKKSVVLLEQIKTIDKKRLIEFMGKASEKVLIDIDRSALISLDLGFKQSTKNCKLNKMKSLMEDKKSEIEKLDFYLSRSISNGVSLKSLQTDFNLLNALVEQFDKLNEKYNLKMKLNLEYKVSLEKFNIAI